MQSQGNFNISYYSRKGWITKSFVPNEEESTSQTWCTKELVVWRKKWRQRLRLLFCVSAVKLQDHTFQFMALQFTLNFVKNHWKFIWNLFEIIRNLVSVVKSLPLMMLSKKQSQDGVVSKSWRYLICSWHQKSAALMWKVSKRFLLCFSHLEFWRLRDLVGSVKCIYDTYNVCICWSARKIGGSSKRTSPVDQWTDIFQILSSSKA